jgi:hypothetical protein
MHNPAIMSSRRSASLLKLFLALLFVCAQQQAVLHTLGHDLERIEQKKDVGGIDESFCAKCLAIAHLDHAVDATSLVLPLVRFAPPLASTAQYESARVALVRHYHSRAPPDFA